MSEFSKGASYARDSILELIKELQGSAADKYATFAVKSAQESLQRAYNEISADYGSMGTEDFQRMGPVSHTSFQNGAEYGKNRISSLIVLLQGEIGHANKYSAEYQALQWLLNSIDEKCATWGNELQEKALESLAVKLNDFYKDFDFYDYMDSIGCFENQEDALVELERQLEDPKAVSGILDTLAEIRGNGELSSAQRLVVDELVLELSEVQVKLGKSVSDVIAEAIERSELNRSGKLTIDILQLKPGDEMHFLRFAHLDWLEDGVNTVHCRNYDHIYSYSDDVPVDLSQKDAVMDLLENVYTKFNIRRPEDFKGHSLSTSDVVILSQGNKAKAFYCDWIGFKELPEHFVKDFSACLDIKDHVQEL